MAPFLNLSAVEIVRSAVFDAAQNRPRLTRAVLFGVDDAAVKCFSAHAVDVVFEAATFYGWRFPLPVIAWIPDFQHRHLPSLFDRKGYWKREAGFRAQIMSGRKIMLSSEDARKDCERFYPSSKKRTSVVPFSVSPHPTFLAQDPVQVAREYGLPEHFFYMPNQFWKHKNHTLVIEALSILKREGRDVIVVATGKPEDPRHPNYYETLNSLVISRALGKNFRSLGMVPRKHVSALMRACVALINPSLFEGWSTTVEEAKSLGVPMLLSDLPVHREQAEHCAGFFSVDSAEQLAALMAEQQILPDLSRQMREKTEIEASQERVKKFALSFVAMLDA